MPKLSRRNFGAVIVAAPLLVAIKAQAADDATVATQAAQETPENIVPMDLVDPELRGALENPVVAAGQFNATNLMAMREGRKAGIVQCTPASGFCQQLVVPGSGAQPSVNILIFNSEPSARLKPAIFYMHGGGYIIGNSMADADRLKEIAGDLDCVIVAVDYRLAPENPFPGPLNDCHHALRWMFANATSLGIDGRLIAVMGQSAGGGMTAQLALAVRDAGDVPVCAQILHYPMLDDRTASSRPVPKAMGHYIWSRESNVYGWTSYLGAPAGGQTAPQGAVPARAENVAGLPPTWVGVGGIDLFAEEDIAYAGRLLAAGVPTELLVLPSAYHAFNRFAPAASVSKRFEASWKDFLRREFAKK